MDKNMIMAVAVSILILFLWPMMFGQNKKKVETTPQTIAKKTEEAAVQQLSVGMKKGETYTIENDVLKIAIDSRGAVVKQATFKKYRDSKNQLVNFFGASAENIGALMVSGSRNELFNLVSKSDDNIVLRSGKATIEYSLDKSLYLLNSKVSVSGVDKVELKLISFLPENTKDQYGLENDPDKRKKELLVYAGDKTTRLKPKEIREKEIIVFGSSPKWVGVDDRYFLFSVIAPKENGMITDVVAKLDKEASASAVDFSLTGKDSSFTYSAFIGPKDVTDLRKVEPTLTESIDYGWLSVISVPMLELMKFFYRIIPNYGVAILILTLFVRLLMFPLQHKSMKSMKKMQALQPHINAIKEKHKDNKEKLNIETMQLFKTHKINPMSGCLPMILQFPVFVALYKVLANSVELYRAPFMFWIQDLSVKDPYYVVPVLMGVMMFIQQKMTPNPTMDPMQAKMMTYMLPIIFMLFMVSLPSGLTLYIMFSTLLGILQQYFTNKQTSGQKA